MSQQKHKSFVWPDAPPIRSALISLAAAPAPSAAADAVALLSRELAERGPTSAALATRARSVIPGGTQHTLAVAQPFPVAVERVTTTTVIDADGIEYVDLVQGGGANLLGDTRVVQGQLAEVIAACPVGTALSHRWEVELAELVVELYPSVERLRMTASGTEAAMAAIRIARAYTGHRHVIKIGSAYHGWSDQLLVGLRVPGSGLAAAGGVPPEIYEYVHEIRPDDLDALDAALTRNEHAGGTAAVVLEPVGPQSGTWPADEDYAGRVAHLCQAHATLLVFDEVVTGIRLGNSGVQGHLGLRPDLTVFGKCIAGGQPGAGAVGGRAEIMQVLGTPTGPGRQAAMVAGTLSGGAVSAAAGVFTLREAARTGAAERAAVAGARLQLGLQRVAASVGLPAVVYNFGSIVHFNFTGITHLDPSASDFADQARSRAGALTAFALACRAEGVLVPITGRMFTNSAMTTYIVDDLIDRIGRALTRPGWAT